MVEEPQPGCSGSQQTMEEIEDYDVLIGQANAKSNKIILDAERFKEKINPPPGKDAVRPAGLGAEGLDVDDQFFHVTCHVDQGLKQKIEKGEFIDLEKLLPKNRNLRTENKLDLVYHDGQSFFVLAQNDSKIAGICKWEQAFCIYAAVYSQTNPTRSAEIWQYVHIINTAAGAYVWENVANYDYTFRQLRSTYPQRNWAKIYNQMWNMSMHEPITRFGQNSSGKKQSKLYGWECKWR